MLAFSRFVILSAAKDLPMSSLLPAPGLVGREYLLPKSAFIFSFMHLKLQSFFEVLLLMLLFFLLSLSSLININNNKKLQNFFEVYPQPVDNCPIFPKTQKRRSYHAAWR